MKGLGTFIHDGRVRLTYNRNTRNPKHKIYSVANISARAHDLSAHATI